MCLADIWKLISKTGRNTSLYSAHSGRQGGASTAHQQGSSLLDIKHMERWRSDSEPQLYIDLQRSSSNPVSDVLARSVSSASKIQSPSRNPNPEEPVAIVSVKGFSGAL